MQGCCQVRRLAKLAAIGGDDVGYCNVLGVSVSVLTLGRHGANASAVALEPVRRGADLPEPKRFQACAGLQRVTCHALRPRRSRASRPYKSSDARSTDSALAF